MTIYFYGSNREIVAENVKKCYSIAYSGGYPFSISGDIRSVPS